MNSKKKILVAPLDWGLGHASRCIPIIHELIAQRCEVLIAADRGPLALLKTEFPQLEFIQLPGYEISYPKRGSMALHLLWQLPKLLSGIKREHKELQKIIQQKRIDTVISDNRYGLWSKSVPSVFVTHQLMIQAPVGKKILHRLNSNYINNYTECWIPDANTSANLSGELSQTKRLGEKIHFIGPLSRFIKTKEVPEKAYDILAVLSGPEPQRSLLETILVKELSTSNLRCAIIQGLPQKKERKKISENVELFSYLNSSELNQYILASELIISRPGYSTIMDLATLGKKAIFIPTPGQTEQEYLAKKFDQEKIAPAFSQNKFRLEAALLKVKEYRGFPALVKDNSTLKKRVEYLLENLIKPSSG